ncbi:MAG: hypothetical protein AB1815_10990 [Bacillota bacterium]|jgi:hypothetical protein
MTNIDTEGMAVANLSENELTRLMETEKQINKNRTRGEVYLLAVSRHSQTTDVGRRT